MLGLQLLLTILVVSDSLTCHVIETEVKGPGPEGNNFFVSVSRSNPAAMGNVTGKQTFVSFLSSIKGKPWLKRNF